jgi:hypothetical protein
LGATESGSVDGLSAVAVQRNNILIHGHCAYYVNEMTPAFRQALATHAALPDICFPLQIGKTWGDPRRGRNLRTAAGHGRKHIDDPASASQNSWRLEAELSSGDHNYVWFKKQIGVVAIRIYHDGTYDNYRVRLLSFRSGYTRP